MPKNTKGGNKAKKGKNARPIQQLVMRDRNENTMYASIIANLGNSKCSLAIISNNGFEGTAIGCVRGSLRKQRFLKDDIVLVGFRDFETKRDNLLVDIVRKYTLDQVQELIAKGEIVNLNNKSMDSFMFVKTNDDNINNNSNINNFEFDSNSDLNSTDSDSDSDSSDSDSDSDSESDSSDSDSDSDKPKSRELKESVQKKINVIGDKKGKFITQKFRQMKTKELEFNEN